MKGKLLLVVLLLTLTIGCNFVQDPNNLKFEIKDTNSKALSDVTITVTDKTGFTVASTRTDSKGEAALEVSPGTYDIRVTLRGYEREEKQVTLSEGAKRTFGITLTKESSCIELWTCTQWSACVDGEQTRTCTDSNECGTTKTMPDETKECEDVPPPPECTFNLDCADNESCTKDSCIEGKCFNEEKTECLHGDDCCPEGCDHTVDNDCVEPDKCQTDIDCIDDDHETRDFCSGTPKRCYHQIIIECIDDDNFCPIGCTSDTDNDCESDPKCYKDEDCDDDDDCTEDICYAGACVRKPIC